MTALRALLHVAERAPAVVAPKRMAEELGESPTYLAKVATQLVKAGILRAERGVKGGVQLAKPAAAITLLEIVESCQGTIVGGYCRSVCRPTQVCGFHLAAQQLETAIAETLKRWTLEQLLKRPRRERPLEDGFSCVMLGPGQVAARMTEAKP